MGDKGLTKASSEAANTKSKADEKGDTGKRTADKSEDSNKLNEAAGSWSQGDTTFTPVFGEVEDIGVEADGDWVLDALVEMGIEYIDKRENGGSLWIVDEKRKQVGKIGELQKRGASFKYSEHGGKATKHKPSWWLKGYPTEKEVEKPRISDAELSTLEEGMTVFHKAFGYGEITTLGDTTVEVAFDDDGGKTRKFMFPSAFYQGLLQIG